MKFEMVLKLKSERIDVKTSCKVLTVSRSGFYAWQDRPEAERTKSNRELINKLRQIHQTSRGTYGAPRITQELKNLGHGCSRTRVAKLMRENKIQGIARKKFCVKTTDSNHTLPIADRVFKVEKPETFPSGPNKVWVSDITFIPTDQGWLYLTIKLDVFTRKIVGYAMTNHLRTEGIIEALKMAIQGQGLDSENRLIVHSDRGCQYASDAYVQKLKEIGITPSMSRKGNCYDNAFAESFFHTLKVELIHRNRFKTRVQAESAVFEYIEVWYNRRRLHSALGYQTPIQYEREALRAV